MLRCALLCDGPPLSPVVMKSAIKSDRTWRGGCACPTERLKRSYSYLFILQLRTQSSNNQVNGPLGRLDANRTLWVVISMLCIK